MSSARIVIRVIRLAIDEALITASIPNVSIQLLENFTNMGTNEMMYTVATNSLKSMLMSFI